MLSRHSSRRRVLGYSSAGLVVAAMAAGAFFLLSPGLRPLPLDPSDPRITLSDVEREVRRRYPVADVTVGTLAGMLAGGRITLFDVRTKEEFDAGHLPGAIRIEPGASAQDILRDHRDRLAEDAIVFYCAVGVRSSRLLMRTLRDLAPQTQGRLYNLRGGVFRWAAHGGALVTGGEPGTPHPFDEDWGQLLARTLPGA
jgi:rhodanese-related sulfurtransferase